MSLSEISKLVLTAKIPPRFQGSLLDSIKYLVKTSYTAAKYNSDRSRRIRNMRRNTGRISPARPSKKK